MTASTTTLMATAGAAGILIGLVLRQIVAYLADMMAVAADWFTRVLFTLFLVIFLGGGAAGVAWFAINNL